MRVYTLIPHRQDWTLWPESTRKQILSLLPLLLLLLTGCASTPQSLRLEHGPLSSAHSGRDRATLALGSPEERTLLLVGAEHMVLEDASRVPALRLGVEHTALERGPLHAYATASVGATLFGGSRLEPDLGLGVGVGYALSSTLRLHATLEEHWSAYGEWPPILFGISASF